MTNVHTCYISTRKVTYASEAQWAPVGSRGSMGRERFQNGGTWRNYLLLLLLCRCQIPFYPQFTYHDCIYFWDLWMCECSLTSTNTKGFFICVLKITWAGISRRDRDIIIIANCLGKFLLDPRRKQYSQKPFWGVPAWIRSPSPGMYFK